MGTKTSKFKQFEKDHRQAIRAKHAEHLEEAYRNKEEVAAITEWVREVDSWSQVNVQQAVYNREGYVEWQIFRASLKDLSTREKLYFLDDYLQCMYDQYDESDGGDREHDVWYEKCRVDNYIGALVRGGQLNSQYLIIKER